MQWLFFAELALIIFLGVRIFLIEKKLRTLFGGSKEKSMEELVWEYGRRLESLEGQSADLKTASNALAQNLSYSVQKVGMLRFNPFSDSGGDQSFAIALLDGNDDGIVISGLYAQGRPLVYAKPIEKGISRYTLSAEEQEALKRASVRV